MVLRVRVHHSTQVFLMGAEFTWACSATFDSRREQPVPNAPTTDRVDSTPSN